MSNKAHGSLIKKIRKFIGLHLGSYSQADMFIDMNKYGSISDPKTAQRAEKSLGQHMDTIAALSRALSARLKEVRKEHPDSGYFDLLEDPEFAWVLHRMLEEIDPPLEPEHLIMNHESRYLVKDYRLSLTVLPTPKATVVIHKSGKEPETFAYDNMAISRCKVTFSEHNQRLEPGFKLRYATSIGRIEVKEPEVENLIDPPGYRLHKTTAAYQPNPRPNTQHTFEVKIFGGYGQGNETMHFSMAQQAIYQNVSFSLDLTAYPEDAFVKTPELVMVPVLAGRTFDCCQIARSGQGLKVEPDERYGLSFRWKFQDLMNVMIGVHWEIKANSQV